MENMDEKRRRENLVEQSVPLALKADVTVLWEPTDFEAAARAELIEVSRENYLARLAAAEKRLHECGLPHERLRASTAEVMAVMADHDLPNTPDGRAAAYLILRAARQK